MSWSNLALNRENASRFVESIERIRSSSQRQWGTMDPSAMFRHMRRAIELSLGEVTVEDKSNFITRSLVRWFVFDSGMSWPKGMKAPAIFFPEKHSTMDEERALLRQAIARFTTAAEDTPQRLGVSELFGPLPMSYWARIHGRHFEHHLKQYGVW